MASRGRGGLRGIRAAARWLLATAVVGTALALGATHTAVLCAAAIVAATAAAAAWWGSRPLPLRREATILLLAGVGLTAWSAIQLVPLPARLLEVVAPANADVWARALLPLREAGPRWAPISLDPVATRIEVLRGVTYLATFLCALKVASSRKGVQFLEAAVLASSVAVALASMAHHAVDAERVFGVYAPRSADFGTRVGPLLNPNHLSAYLNVGTCIALAMTLSRGETIPRAVTGGIVVVLLGAQVWVASRAGFVAAGLGVGLVLWLDARQRDAPPPRWRGAAAAAAGVLLTGFLVATRPALLRDLLSTDTVKLQTIRRTVGLVATFPWVGVGRGSFESVFPAFRADGEGNLVFTHPENVPLQWASEWGLPVAMVGLGVLAFALRPGVALQRSAPPIGAASAILAVAAHNLLDFSSEIPAVVIALATCAACVAGGRHRRSSRPPWWTPFPRAIPTSGAALVGICVTWTAGAAHGELRQDRERLRSLALSTAVGREAFVDAARSAMLRHPAEPYLPFMGAVRAARVTDESPIPWISRTLERSAVYGRAHLLLARYLARRSPAQARLEYRLAGEQDYNLLRRSVTEGATLVEQPDDALDLVPEGRFRLDALEILEAELRPRAPAAADAVMAQLASAAPDHPLVVRRELTMLLVSVEGRAAPCEQDRAGCLSRAAALALVLVDRLPTRCDSHQALARVRTLQGDAAAAEAVLEAAVGRVEDPQTCLRVLVERAEDSGDDARLAEALERLVGSACATDAACAAAHVEAAAVHVRRGRLQQAMKLLKRAHTRMPDRVDVLVALATTASSASLHAQAAEAYADLVRLQPGNAAWAEAHAREAAAAGATRVRALAPE